MNTPQEIDNEMILAKHRAKLDAEFAEIKMMNVEFLKWQVKCNHDFTHGDHQFCSRCSISQYTVVHLTPERKACSHERAVRYALCIDGECWLCMECCLRFFFINTPS